MLPPLKFNFLRVPADPSFRYPKRRSVLIPALSIRLFNKDDQNLFQPIKALIDSGAGFSIFPVEIARLLGLTLEDDRIEELQGINGVKFKGYLQDFILEVGGWKFNSFGFFTQANIVVPVLGRDGFFSLFEVRLNLSKESIELKAVVDHLKS